MHVTPLKYAQRQEVRQISCQEKKENVFFFYLPRRAFHSKSSSNSQVNCSSLKKNKRFRVQLILWLTSQGALVLSLLIVPRKTRLVYRLTHPSRKHVG